MRNPEQRGDLGGDRGEDVARRNGFGHQCRDAAERRLLRRNPLQFRARRGVRDRRTDELGECADAHLGVRGQGRRSRGADGHDPPEPSPGQDRNPDRRANPYEADILGHQACGVAVVVDAGRLLRVSTRPMMLSPSTGTRVPTGIGCPRRLQAQSTVAI